MNQIITKDFYIKSIGKSVKRIKTDKGYLYDYLDLCREVLLPDRERNYMFYEWVLENEREEINIGGRSLVKYVTAEGFKRIIDRNYQRGIGIYNDLIQAEFEESSELIDKINNLSNGTATEVIDGIYNIYHSQEYKEQLWKLHPEIDKDKDILSEKIHYDLVYNDLEYDEYTIMKRKSDTGEERWEKYKKNPNKGTSCPAWLMDIIK